MRSKRIVGTLFAVLFTGMVVYATLCQHVLLAHAGVAAFGRPSAERQPQATAADWPMFLGGLGRSGYNVQERIITTKTASKLHLKWSVKGVRGVSAQPVVVGGKIFWGSWDGYMHATDLNGHQLWTTFLGVAHGKCRPMHSGIAGTASVATVPINGKPTQVVFVGGGNSNLYALNAATGKVIWHVPVGSTPDYYIWGAPAVYQGSVYIGVASYGDCPLIQGSLLQMNATTGAIQHVFKTVADHCVGGGIWDAPTIDVATGMLYISTGTRANCNPYESLATALIKLRASNLSLVDSWQVPPAQTIPDGDFGSTPTLFNATINGSPRLMVGLINKNGVYYAFDRNNLRKGPVWQARLGDHQVISMVNMSSSAWDGTRLYVASSEAVVAGKECHGSIRALNPANGSFFWERCLSADPFDSVMAAPGMVILGDDAALMVLDARTGVTLYKYLDQRTVVSEHMYGWGNPCLVNGTLYAGNMAGNFYALGL